MRDLSSFVEAAMAAETGKMFWFLEFQFDTIIRYTDADVDLYGVSNFYNSATEGSNFLVTEGDAYLITEQGYESNKFETMPFEIQTINFGAKTSVDKVIVDIANVDLQMSAIFLNEDVINKWGILQIGFLDSNNTMIDQPIEIFRGLVSTWKLTEPKAEIVLMNEFVFWNKRTLRKHQASCRWAFKGTECTYAGAETWCDRSYARCGALSNTDNFGGERWLPDLMEREIYWGKTT